MSNTSLESLESDSTGWSGSNQDFCQDNAAYQLNRSPNQAHSEEYSYRKWRDSPDKSNSNFYEPCNKIFLRDYTAEQMDRNRNLIRCLIRDELRSFISSSDQTSYKVLSLGCGPGSDLLAVMDVFQTSRNAHNHTIHLVDLIGVDGTLWPMKKFRDQLSELVSSGPTSATEQVFRSLDMEYYVNHALAKDLRFDLIIMSFAEVKTKMTFVSEQLPRLLRDRGKIFIVDNDIPPVWKLSDFGFKLVDRRTNTVFMAK